MEKKTKTELEGMENIFVTLSNKDATASKKNLFV